MMKQTRGGGYHRQNTTSLTANLERDAYEAAAATVAEAMAACAEYAGYRAERWRIFELAGAFEDVVAMPGGTRARIAHAYPAIEDVDALVAAAWAKAVEHRAIRRDEDDGLAFPIPLPMKRYASHPTELVIRPSQRKGSKHAWYASFFSYLQPTGKDAEPVFLRTATSSEHPAQAAVRSACAHDGSRPSATAAQADAHRLPKDARSLKEYAWLGKEGDLLARLARIAAPECWSDGRELPYGVLSSYLACTFARAQQQDLVAELPQEDFSAFNTGLATSFGTPVFMCFHIAKSSTCRQEWEFDSFAEPGVGHAGKRLAEFLGSQLPEQPSYSHLAYDGADVLVDYRHLICRIHRLPASFVRRALEGSPRSLELLAHVLGDPSRAAHPDAYRELVGHLLTDSGDAAAVRTHLAAAVEASMGRLRERPDLAACSYSPNKGTEALLLPLWLDSDDPAAALVATPVANGWQVHTVIQLPRTYCAARVTKTHRVPWLASIDMAQGSVTDEDAAWAKGYLAELAARHAAATPAPAEAASAVVAVAPHLVPTCPDSNGNPAAHSPHRTHRLAGLLAHLQDLLLAFRTQAGAAGAKLGPRSRGRRPEGIPS